MKFLFALLTTCVSVLLLTSCQNTANGFSKDFQKNTKEIRKEINS